jgi:peptide/nickel transport system substrate-binding protein
MKRIGIMVSLILVVGLLACSLCVPAASAEKVLTVGTLSGDARQLDPHVSTATQDKIVMAWMFNGLVRFKPGTADPAAMEPDLAEKWESSPDALTWTFFLRKGVQFHANYGELTSEDAVYSIKRAASKDTSTAYLAYSEFSEVTALDKYTVRIKLNKPVPSLLGLVSNFHGGMIVSKKAAEEKKGDFKLHPIGTGPFAFQEYKPKNSVTLVAHKDHFRGRPKIDKILYRFMNEDASRELAFVSGELQLAYGTREQQWVEKMQKQKNTVVDIFGLGEQRTLHINSSIKPLDDVRIRRAIAHAINRDDVVNFMGKATSIVSTSVVPDGYLGFAKDVPQYSHSVEKAKSLLKEAGYPNGFTLKVIITKVDPLRLPMEIIQEQLRKVGIKLELDVVEHSAFHKLIRENASALVLYGAARFPVADAYLTEFYHSNAIVGKPTAVANFSHCTAADAEIDAARSEQNPAKQIELWKKAQQKIMGEAYAVPIFELLQVYVRKANLEYGHPIVNSISNGPILDETTDLK